ncbi:hypothetical protein RLJV_23430 [Pseudomonas aeruginosa]|nr:hypothetical protein RLJV_23430 [Pseudomonas aeruginosa]
MLGLSLAGLRLHETWRPLLLSLVRVWGGFAVGYGIAAGLGMEAVFVHPVAAARVRTIRAASRGGPGRHQIERE